ncbi:MAG TPA: CAP domain-containing protein [Jatrophihabitans sp.]|jgi:uncharacterized protein YkwD|nr:CAP domain-containing protein [Jatrophihabitans sp.]
MSTPSNSQILPSRPVRLRPWLLPSRRLRSALTAMAAAAAVLVAPQLTTPASAITYDSATAQTFAKRMLTLMNTERHNNGRPDLQMNYKLVLSAHRHNLTMAGANVMSHQLAGEAFFATRISRAGYAWRMVGENVGWNSEMSTTGLLSLQKEMFNERPPGEIGHRQNILNRNFKNVGIDVYFDLRNHKVWFTQDFGQPA